MVVSRNSGTEAVNIEQNIERQAKYNVLAAKRLKTVCIGSARRTTNIIWQYQKQKQQKANLLPTASQLPRHLEKYFIYYENQHLVSLNACVIFQPVSKSIANLTILWWIYWSHTQLSQRKWMEATTGDSSLKMRPNLRILNHPWNGGGYVCLWEERFRTLRQWSSALTPVRQRLCTFLALLRTFKIKVEFSIIFGTCSCFIFIFF